MGLALGNLTKLVFFIISVLCEDVFLSIACVCNGFFHAAIASTLSN